MFGTSKTVLPGGTDVDLSPEGAEQAKRAGQLLKKHSYNFDEGFTSVLKRSIKTLHIILEELDHLWNTYTKIMAVKRAFLWCLTRFE